MAYPAIRRVQKEKKELLLLEECGIYIYDSDPEDIMNLQVMIYGPEGTPYEGG